MRRFFIWCGVIVVLAALTVGWNHIWRAVGVPQIKAETLEMWLFTRPPAGAEPPLLVDVRTGFEYNWFHIPGAVHAPGVIWGDTHAIDAKIEGRTVVVVCMTGHRSQFGAWSLIRHGAADVRNLEWGMIGWLLSGGPVISSDQEPAAGPAANGTNATQRKGTNENG